MTEPAPGGRLVFYREVPVDDVSLVARRLFSTVFAWRCPACGRAGVSAGPFSVRALCGYCGSRFQRLEGNELVSIPLSFFFASVVTFLVALPLVGRYGFFPGVTWVLLAVGLLTVLLGFKPMRVVALFLLWLIGFVFPDWVDKGKTVTSYEEARVRSRSPGAGNRAPSGREAG